MVSLLARWLSIVVVAAPLATAQISSHSAPQTRPIQLGTAGGNANDEGRKFCCGGTLGCLVTDNNGTLYILSCNHVLARRNFAQVGEPITQPGLVDANCLLFPSDTVATLTSFAPLLYRKKVKWSRAPTNFVDAAIAAVIPGQVATDGSILGIGQPSTTTVAPFVGMAVKKSGRTTGLTRGTIQAIDVTIIATYSQTCGKKNKMKALFPNQIRILPETFSAGGDSGALIVEDVETCPRPVGLLFAGGRTHTMACRIDDVLNTFNVSIVGCSAAPARLAQHSAAIPGVSAERLQQAKTARHNHAEALHDLPGVVGTGLSRSDTDAAQPVIEIYVEKDTGALRRKLPPDLDGVAVRVVVTGTISAH